MTREATIVKVFEARDTTIVPSTQPRADETVEFTKRVVLRTNVAVTSPSADFFTFDRLTWVYYDREYER